MADTDLLIGESVAVPSQGPFGAVAKRGWLTALWVTLRPSQWVKNLFVLAPIFFSQHAFSPELMGRSLAALGLFCMMSSAMYVFNDLNDREQDRLHPKKCRRPLASGELGIGTARAAMGGLWLFALAGGSFISRPFTIVVGAYGVLNLLYSVRLKHVVILDVFVIAAGYLLRVVGGAMVIKVDMSTWLLICTTLLALFIALCKRRHEVVLLEEEAHGHRQVLSDYPLQFLDLMISVLASAALVSYSLYTVSEEIVRKFGRPGLLLTVPFVLYGFFRYLFIVYRKEEGGDPTQNILTDRPMLVNWLLWAMTAGAILYARTIP